MVRLREVAASVRPLLRDTVSATTNLLNSNEYKLNPLGHGLQVMSVEDSLGHILADQLSVTRFGDGEMRLMRGESIGFQRADRALADELVRVARSSQQNLALCVPGVFGALKSFTPEVRRIWRRHLFRSRRDWTRFFDEDRTYFNAFITRPYMDWADKSQAALRFDLIRELWKGRDVLVVEGDGSRLGVGNPLFESATSVERVVCPPRGAWQACEEIRAAVTEHAHDRLVVLALGPTATVLSANLAATGLQAIDLGHLDVEFEWFLQKAQKKSRVPGKHVNEAPGGGAWGVGPTDYENQIVARII